MRYLIALLCAVERYEFSKQVGFAQNQFIEIVKHD